MATPKPLKEAVYKLNRVGVILTDSLAEQPEFSLAGERAKELLTETRAWFEEYVEEVSEGDGSTGAGATG